MGDGLVCEVKNVYEKKYLATLFISLNSKARIYEVSLYGLGRSMSM